MKKSIVVLAFAFVAAGTMAQLTTNNGQQYLLNQSLDMSQQFFDMSNTYFTADSLAAFDKATGVGKIKWTRQQLHARQAFNANGQWIIPLENLDFPGPAYDQSPELQFTIEPVNNRTVRVRLYTSPIIPKDNYDDEVMLVGDDFGGDYVHWWLFKDSDGIQKQHINYTQASDAYMPPPYVRRKIAEVFQRTAEKYGILEG